MDKNFLLGVGVTNASKEEILKYILTGLEKTKDSYYITTPNPEILVHAQAHSEFKAILNNARLGLPDGIGVIWAGKILGISFVERVTGTDFMEYLCKEVAEKPITVGFLGGKGGVAEMTAECLQGRYPGLKVVFVSEEWGEEGFDKAKKYQVVSNKGIKGKVVSSKGELKSLNTQYIIHNTEHIDVLFVAFGFPKQEEFMAKNIGKIPVKVMIGVGGAFDYISGTVSRAPLLIRSIGFEWLFRLLIQPWRVRRQLALITFLWLVLKEKFGINAS